MNKFDRFFSCFAWPVAVLIVLLLGALVFDTRHRKTQALHPDNVSSLHAPLETIQVSLTDVKVLGRMNSQGGEWTRFRTYNREWSGLQTLDWILIRGGDTGICHPILDMVAEHNDIQAVPISGASLDLTLAALENQTVSMAVHVPRLAVKPNGLQECPGFQYDEASKTLKVGNRTVAILAGSQAGLRVPEGAQPEPSGSF